MTENTIIFIKNGGSPKKTRSVFQKLRSNLFISPYELQKRIFHSLIPPFCGQKYQQIYVDLLGPFVAILILVTLLQYGHNSKLPWAVSKFAPTSTVLGYVCIMPFLTYISCKIAKSDINVLEVVSVLGYSLFGHILTLLTSLVLYNEESNFVFFICLLFFGGLSTLRIVVILVACIPKPALRFIVCSFVSIIQLLFLVFLHFLYMHKRFIYGGKSRFLSRKLNFK